MLWGNFVSENFVRLLQNQNPGALVILALFCAMQSFFEERWIWAKWPIQVVRLIRQIVEPEWYEWIDWSADVIEKNLKYQDAKSSQYSEDGTDVT